jgi:hypothetical protein
LTCSYCSKIFRDQIKLPCGDSICREHLSERNVVKQNKIKCKKCNDEFGVKNNQFKSNNELKSLIESHSYSSREEISLKHELEQSIRQFFEFYDEFIQNKNKIESDVFDHFQEMRFKIDEHREELKKRIDDIALGMIDQTKIYEETYLKELKEHFSSFDTTQSLANELNQKEETFRNPNLLIETIEDMQQKQEESLNGIQSKLNEMNQVKDKLKATNEFKPKLSLFNQKEEDTSLFGSIRLNACWLNVNSFIGQILTDLKQFSELIKLCQFSPNDKWSLLYRATWDGFGSHDFHSKCDGHSNTLTILKAKESEFIFGGFTTVTWESSSLFKSDPNAFLFSLTNRDKRPLKTKIDPNKHQHAIHCNSDDGPTFGGHDIKIANNANTTRDSWSNLGFIYRHPQYANGTSEASTFLAGSHKFLLDEIEVYQKESNEI